MNDRPAFVEFVVQIGALKFGNFTLKSGRISPYFFNTGVFNKAEHLAKLGQFYASTIIEQGIDFSILFGAAYKGIPLAAATAVVLYEQYNMDVAYSFNRKEIKDHGEGGQIVGAQLSGDILIIDDVITAGTAIAEVMKIMQQHPVNVKGVVVALDRQECGTGTKSTMAELGEKYQLLIFSIISLSDIINYLKQQDDSNLVAKIKVYQQKYGA